MKVRFYYYKTLQPGFLAIVLIYMIPYARSMSIPQYPLLSQLIRTLKLPIPIPPRLERTQAPWSEHPLQGGSILLGAAAGSFWTDTILPMLQATGAQVQWSPEETDSDATLRALIFDASGINEPNELWALYDFFHPRLRRLLPCGRILVLGIPPVLAANPGTAATAQALEGFCRSLAREVDYFYFVRLEII